MQPLLVFDVKIKSVNDSTLLLNCYTLLKYVLLNVVLLLDLDTHITYISESVCCKEKDNAGKKEHCYYNMSLCVGVGRYVGVH